MAKIRKEDRLIAHYLRIKPEELDRATLREAREAVHRENTTYWDAIAQSGQLHGNVPHNMMVAFTYLSINGDL